ncbi:pantetheine-phosphate adenylyltransferase [Jiella sp. MQZ9-1]|uniref:Phosphopantetheine adenylyltransferase n=1 Tax=Jiella flava TaxID=2816857 RepID=A0A939FZN8_9HYPH|nr:pantetheine-phosphate adenylyltransferase [Jiella flava]MBO0662938.1 pantetheine-phosphate adenylyltransferase [Jiella flava]MCD2471302.1 pantetheine-phosphate adenylyltransferase [Jiella flava]
MRRAFYPGSFDPLTNGHLAVLAQAMTVFDEIFVGIGVHPGKTPLFSFDERVALIEQGVAALGDNAGKAVVSVVSFDGLVVEAARAADAVALVRGVRDGTDLNYEMQMAGMNGAMRPEIVTLFFPASPETRPITATLVRQIAAMGGDVSRFVPGHVAQAIRGKHGRA